MRSSPYYRFLQEAASRLAVQYGQVAVPIGRIAFDHGIHIERSHEIPKFKAHMVVPSCPQDWVRVILHKSEHNLAIDGPSNYDRFCVAHELAHLLLYREFGAQPVDRASYWKHEFLCDEFARTLLVPDSYLNQIIEMGTNLQTLRRAADTVKVPMMHVARRISRSLPQLVFFQIQKKKSNRWLVVASSLDSAKETGKSICSIISANIETFSRSGAASKRWSVDGSTLRRSNFDIFDTNKMYELTVEKHKNDADSVTLSIFEGVDVNDLEWGLSYPIEYEAEEGIQNVFCF